MIRLREKIDGSTIPKERLATILAKLKQCGIEAKVLDDVAAEVGPLVESLVLTASQVAAADASFKAERELIFPGVTITVMCTAAGNRGVFLNWLKSLLRK